MPASETNVTLLPQQEGLAQKGAVCS
jgi:hypothetical protein